MKHLLLTTIAAVLLAECGESQPSTPPVEGEPAEPVTEPAQPESSSESAAVKRGAAGRRPDSIIYGMPHFALVPSC